MSDINFGTQGRNVCMGFCKKVSVCKLQRGEYLMRTNDFGKNPLPARAMEEDTSYVGPMWVSRVGPMWVLYILCGSLAIAEYEIILFQIRQVLLECGYTHFPCKTGK